MKITYFDSEASILKFNNKFIKLRPYLLVSEIIYFGANSPWVNLFNADVDTFSDQMTFDLAKLIFARSEASMNIIADLEKSYPILKLAKNVKHKDRDTLNLIGFINNGIKILKRNLKKSNNEFLKIYNIVGFEKFNFDNIWQLLPIDCFKDPTKEDVFIQPISDLIIGRESLMSMDGICEGLFTFSLHDSANETGYDFIKIPLWHFPKLEDLNYAQLKYTRNDIQGILLPFMSKLAELSASIFSLPFTRENQTQIKYLYKTKISHLVDPIQNSIDESLYLLQMKNKYGNKDEFKFCLGITSAEILIDYYEKTQIILPYVANQIKQRVGRHIDLKANYVFTYIETVKDMNAIE
jgi:hypothetical protein